MVINFGKTKTKTNTNTNPITLTLTDTGGAVLTLMLGYRSLEKIAPRIVNTTLTLAFLGRFLYFLYQ